MVDRDLLRQNPEFVRESLKRRGEDPKLVDEFLIRDAKWRQLLHRYEQLTAEKKQLSRLGKPTAEGLKKAKELTAEQEKLGKEETKEFAASRAILDKIPNLVAQGVPVGEGESANTVLRRQGQLRVQSGRSHEDLMANLGWVDLEAAAAFSGSRFRYVKGEAAIAHMSLMNEGFRWAIKNNFVPVIPPVLTRAQTLEQAGFFPSFKDDIFKIEKEDLYLTGTSEQTLLALVANKTFNLKELPLRFVGFSTCFRKEVGSYGKDVKGMFRQHQFDKVEMISITTQENSEQEHQFLVKMQEDFVRKFDLPYEVVLIGSGDLGPTASKKIDIETWFPSQQRYRETHSASNCTDYQARRFSIKYRDARGQEQSAHTLNATLVTERLLLAIIENNQKPDGSVNLPRVLR